MQLIKWKRPKSQKLLDDILEWDYLSSFVLFLPYTVPKKDDWGLEDPSGRSSQNN